MCNDNTSEEKRDLFNGREGGREGGRIERERQRKREREEGGG